VTSIHGATGVGCGCGIGGGCVLLQLLLLLPPLSNSLNTSTNLWGCCLLHRFPLVLLPLQFHNGGKEAAPVAVAAAACRCRLLAACGRQHQRIAS